MPRHATGEPLRWSSLGHEVTVEFSHGAHADRCIRELVGRGASIPLQHRREWIPATGDQETWFVSIRPNSANECTYGLALRSLPRRTMPGHRYLRVERFGATDDPVSAEVMLRAIARLAQTVPRVVQVAIGVFSKQPKMLRRIGEHAQALGYRKFHTGSVYLETVAVDLRPEEGEILASFASRARRGIRAPAKRGLEVNVVTDVGLAARMSALRQESMRRTGRTARTFDFEPHIAIAASHPEFLQIVGTFDPQIRGPRSLVGYAIGEMHGDHATYSHAACVPAAVSNTPITHAPTWSLMRWAKENGATWFDFGGISGSEGDEPDPLRGISEFKKTFSQKILRVGDEWTLDVRPVRARIATGLSNWIANLSVGRGRDR